MKSSIDEEVAFQTAKLQVYNASINRTPCSTAVHVFLEAWRWDIETAVIISYLHLTHPKFDWKVIFPINAFPVSTDYIICFSSATMIPITNWCTYTCWGYEATRLSVKLDHQQRNIFCFQLFKNLREFSLAYSAYILKWYNVQIMFHQICN